MGQIKKSEGNMFKFVTHTWNPIKGKCYHECSYCYAKQEGDLVFKPGARDVNLDDYRNYFVCSNTDLFSERVPTEMIRKILRRTRAFQNNTYLFHTKNPARVIPFVNELPEKCSVGVTIETDIHYPGTMGNCPTPFERASDAGLLKRMGVPIMVTIEPVMHFRHHEFQELIGSIRPFQINIGADSKGNPMVEPRMCDLVMLLRELYLREPEETVIHLKDNLEKEYPGIREKFQGIQGEQR